MLTKYPDLDDRVRRILVQLGSAANIDRCRAALQAEGVSASRATVGRSVMRVREGLQFEALAAGYNQRQAEATLQPPTAEALADQSYVHAFEHALGDFVTKMRVVAHGMTVSTPRELLLVAKTAQVMVKMLIDSDEVIETLKAIEAKKAENRKRLLDEYQEARNRLAGSIDSRRRLRVLRKAVSGRGQKR